jgi:hypothetical protein
MSTPRWRNSSTGFLPVYQTFGKGVVRSLNLAIAVLMNRSIEGGRCLTEGLFVGCLGNEPGGVLGPEEVGKLLFDVLIISF